MELLNLVRATPTSDTGRHGSTAAICRELAQKLNSRFVVDISQRFFHHVLCLVYPFEILLILCGRWFNVDDMRRFGWKAFWLTLGINFSVQALGDWMRRKGRQGQAIATYCWEVCADRLTRSRTGKVGAWVRRITGGRP
jgi:hypothetical protein